MLFLVRYCSYCRSGNPFPEVAVQFTCASAQAKILFRCKEHVGVFLISKAYEGSIDYFQVMDEGGNIDQSLFPKDVDDSKMVSMYKYMLLTRALDAKILSLQRQGRAATYAPSLGEEAVHIGCAFAMRKQDFFVPNFRQHGMYVVRGFPLDRFILYWKGFEEGDAVPQGFNGLSVSVPVGSQMPQGAGIAYAFKYKKRDAVAIAFVGDGGTSEGDFYESMNFGGVFKLPLIGLIENNQWAISMPRNKQTASKTLAQKGIAAGIACVQVDGNDMLAVYKAVQDAIANAKNGPTLIEAVTYRMGMHTTSDDPTKYRPDADAEAWRKKDPIVRVRAYLTKKGLWNDVMEQQANEEQLKQIDEAVAKAEAFKPDPKSMFENVYSFMPEVLKQEEDAAEAANFWR